MRNIAIVALMLNFGVASVYAQHGPVTMSFSGTAVPSTSKLQDDAMTSEYSFVGNGTLGSFTFRTLSASVPSQAPASSPCARYFSTVAGAGVFRFQDESLLMVKLTEGSDCIEFPPTGPMARCIRSFQITGGTGRFKNVTPGSVITLTETVLPVLFDVSGSSPVFSAITGEATGTVSGAATDQGSQDRRP